MRRSTALVIGGAAVLCGLVAAHLVVGRSELGVGDTLRALLGSSTVRAHETIVFRYRLPRALVGIGAGALLALSGVLLQAVMRNPLAEPGTAGVGSGAALGVVVSLILFPGNDFAIAAALLGAVGAGSMLFAVGRRSLAVGGILIGAVLGAVTSLLLVVDGRPMGVVLRWLIGSLNARTQGDWNSLWPWVLALIAAGWFLAPAANVLDLGDIAATGLGVRPGRTRFVLLAIAVVAAATAIAAAGAVAFIGLMAPHAARALVGSDHRELIPVAAVLGAICLSAADLMAFSITVDLPGAGPAVSGLPVGALTALLGAPYLIWLVRRERHERRHR